MKSLISWQRAGAAAILVAGLGSATLALAIRVDNAGAPASAAVLGTPQQAAKAQADESASLRQGVVTGLDGKGARLQVQGIWLEVVAGKTQVLRNGAPTPLETLKIGDSIRFMVAPGSAEGQSLRVIYAP
jgi:hypothetical protein